MEDQQRSSGYKLGDLEEMREVYAALGFTPGDDVGGGSGGGASSSSSTTTATTINTTVASPSSAEPPRILPGLGLALRCISILSDPLFVEDEIFKPGLKWPGGPPKVPRTYLETKKVREERAVKPWRDLESSLAERRGEGEGSRYFPQQESGNDWWHEEGSFERNSVYMYGGLMTSHMMNLAPIKVRLGSRTPTPTVPTVLKKPPPPNSSSGTPKTTDTLRIQDSS